MGGGRSPKTKGDGYERELAAYLNTNVFGGREQVARAIMSGSLGGGTGRGIGGSDLTGAPLLYVEAKRTEKLRPQWSLVQAFTNAAHRKTQDIPVVISRKNRETTAESVVVMRLEDFTVLYKYALQRLGFIHESGD
jgi:hypothetical protein